MASFEGGLDSTTGGKPFPLPLGSPVKGNPVYDKGYVAVLLKPTGRDEKGRIKAKT